MTNLRKIRSLVVLFVLKANGMLYVRISQDGVRAPERSTGIRVSKEDWDSKAQRITRNAIQTQFENIKLDLIKMQVYEAQQQLERKGERVTARKLCSMVFDDTSKAKTLDQVFQEYKAFKKATDNLSPVTYRGHDKYYRNVTRYFTEIGLKNPLVDDITKERFLGLLDWLKSQYSQDYVVKNAQYLKAIYGYAFANGYVDRNPLVTIPLRKAGHYDTTHLTQEQVKQLAIFDFSKLPLPADSIRVLDEERDAFVLTSYTGLHHVDYTKGDYKVELIKDRQWLTGHRVKSQGGRKDKTYSMPLHPLALAIIEKYGGVENLPKRNNAKRNIVLKQIAAHVGLKVHLTTKIARKTLANYCLNVIGMKVEVLAAVLGHSSTKFVKHYATITNDAIDREMKF